MQEPPRAEQANEADVSPVRPSFRSERWKMAASAWLEEINAADRSVVRRKTYELAHGLAHEPYISSGLRRFGASGSAQGVRALARGRLLLNRTSDITLVLDAINWQALPTQDRSTLWHLQQWGVVRDCAHEVLFHRKFQGVTKIAPFLRRWVDANLTRQSLTNSKSLAWHDHATALRALHAVSYLHMLALSSARLEEIFPRLDVFIELHIRLLMHVDFYAQHTNHGFDQAFALYLLGNLFPGLPFSSDAQGIGRERLKDEILYAFSEEGIHIENSPSYQPLMMARILQASQLLGAYGDHASELKIEETFNRGLDFLTYALRPDGTLPLLGDSDSSPVRLNFGETSPAENRPYFDYAITSGLSGTRPPFLSRVYPRAGYAFLRDRWGSRKDFQDIIHISFRCGFLSSYHRHDDDNTILLYAFGEDWLIDGGLYKYQEDDALRRYLRSARAHNILSVVGVEATRELPESTRLSGFFRWRSVGEGFEVCGRSRITPGFIYERDLSFFRKARRIFLTDRMTPKLPGPHAYQSRFHFPADKAVEINGAHSLIIKNATNSRQLKIDIAGPTGTRIEIVQGQKESDMAGWTSTQPGRIDEAKTCIISFSAAEKFEMTTDMVFLK